MKKCILSFILGLTIMGCVVYAADLLMDAKSISYTSEYTENDNVADVLSELLANGTAQATLMWTNSDPTVAFDPQTVTFDNSAPDDTQYYIVKIIMSSEYSGVYSYGLVPISSSLTNYHIGGNYINGTTLRRLYSRQVISTSYNSIRFGTGWYSVATGTSDQQGTSYGVPVEIYATNVSL